MRDPDNHAHHQPPAERHQGPAANIILTDSRREVVEMPREWNIHCDLCDFFRGGLHESSRARLFPTRH
ncbi:MAG: hypothetical protein A2Z44_11210 [Betaproteobacteria bacterium RBG_19FT_COMBO_58_11]|nr:MAG: hypothetical protein A2Z44_11210 [Betaproteobacteria bacterium RBG_19FT_COMBO_58_11]